MDQQMELSKHFFFTVDDALHRTQRKMHLSFRKKTTKNQPISQRHNSNPHQNPFKNESLFISNPLKLTPNPSQNQSSYVVYKNSQKDKKLRKFYNKDQFPSTFQPKKSKINYKNKQIHTSQKTRNSQLILPGKSIYTEAQCQRKQTKGSEKEYYRRTPPRSQSKIRRSKKFDFQFKNLDKLVRKEDRWTPWSPATDKNQIFNLVGMQTIIYD